MAQRLVAFQPAPRPRQQPEPVTETVADILGAHRHHPRRRQLDRQRDPVQAPTDLRHRRRPRPSSPSAKPGVHRLGSFHEQLHRRRRRPRRRRRATAPATTARPPTRSPSRDVAITFTVVGAGQDRLDQVGGRVQDVLAVVQHDQQPPPRQRLGDAVGHREPGLGGDAQHGGHHVGHRRRVADGRQLDQPHPVGELAGQLGRDLHRQAGLAHPAHPGQGHQPMGPHLLGQLLHLDVAAHEARRLHRQVPRHRVQRPQRRELDPQPVGAHLVQVLDTRQVTQPMLAPIDQLDPRHHRRRGRRHQDLAAVPGGHHPRRPVQHRPK